MTTKYSINVIFIVTYYSHIKYLVLPIEEFLKKNGIFISVFHMESLNFGNESNYQEYSFPTYDVGIITNNELFQIIKKIKPSVAIFLNWRSFYHFYILRVIKSLNIPSIYLSFGLHSTNHLKYSINNIFYSIVRYFRIFQKYFFFIIKSNCIIKELDFLYKALVKRNYVDSKFDYVILYTKNKLMLLQDIFKFSNNKIFYSGYPVFKNDLDEENIYNLNYKNEEDSIVYIHQPFIIDGTSNANLVTEQKFYNELVIICTKNNRKLNILLHPKDKKKRFNFINNPNVNIYQNYDFTQLILRSNVIIGHYSTLLFAAILMYKPIVTIPFPGVIFPVNLFDDITFKVNKLFELKSILNQQKKISIDKLKYDEFIERYIGKNNTYEHQAGILIKLIRKCI